MQENIRLRFSPLVSIDLRNIIQALLENEMRRVGSDATVVEEEVDTDLALADGLLYQYIYTGSSHFATPDGALNYTSQASRTVQGRETPDLGSMFRLLGARNEELVKAYRDALRGMANLATGLDNGSITSGVEFTQYLAATLTAGVDAFPNSN